LRNCDAATELESLPLYLPIPAVDANPTAKRDHPIANEARYRHYNQELINDDNSTIGQPRRDLPVILWRNCHGQGAPPGGRNAFP
jgi:hypothetical protein